MASVRSLGYAEVSATDLQAWESFGADLLGLQVAERTPHRLRLRMDEYAYRIDVRKADRDGVSVLGWEVAGPAELEALENRLSQEGYAVKRLDRDAARERLVSGLISFEDPDGATTLELYYGLKQSVERFVSPTGATFVTGTGGLGHAFQLVNDVEAYRRLYFDVLGFRLSDYIDHPSGAELTFTHCNSRHHSFAFGNVPNAPAMVGHLMFEVTELDIVGRALDKILEGQAKLSSTLGKHTNDKMVSFYVDSPSKFGIEYGFGGLEIDDATWTPTRYDEAHYWGHHREGL